MRQWDVEATSDVFDRLILLGDDTDGFGDGFGSDGVVTGNHDDCFGTNCCIGLIYVDQQTLKVTFDTGRAALGYSVGYGSARRVDHGDESDEAQTEQREVGFVGVVSVAFGIFVEWQHEVAESEYSLTQSTQFHVGGVEGIFHVVVEYLLFSVDENSRTTFQDSLGSALHDQDVTAVVLVLVLVDRHLVLVGRVERNLADLLVAGSHGHRLTGGQFGALEQSSLRCIAVHFAFQHWNAFLIRFEFRTAA